MGRVLPSGDRAEGGQVQEGLPGPPEAGGLTEAQARAAVATAHRRLGELGLIIGSSGNVSARFGAGMVITPTGGGPEGATDAAMVVTGLDAPAAGASSEWALHAAIYRQADAAGAIVHTHSDACTALSALREGLPAFHYMLAGFGGEVRCAPYVTFGTPELARVAAEAIRDRSACLLANHGMVVHAADAARAVAAARTLEMLARQYLLARAAGEVQMLTSADMHDAGERFKTYGRVSTPNVQTG